MKSIILSLFTISSAFICSHAQASSDAILGKWITTDNKLIVQVYKQNNDYKAKIIWFKASDNMMNERLDEKNPDMSLRTRRWIGMDVLRNLRYDAENKEWTDGLIYDAKHGKEWSSVAWIDDDNLLRVKGYWIFKFMCETLTLKKL